MHQERRGIIERSGKVIWPFVYILILHQSLPLRMWSRFIASFLVVLSLRSRIII